MNQCKEFIVHHLKKFTRLYIISKIIFGKNSTQKKLSETEENV